MIRDAFAAAATLGFLTLAAYSQGYRVVRMSDFDHVTQLQIARQQEEALAGRSEPAMEKKGKTWHVVWKGETLRVVFDHREEAERYLTELTEADK